MQLAEMGFPLEACRKAVYYTGSMGAELAFNWIIAHMEDPGQYNQCNVRAALLFTGQCELILCGIIALA